MYAQDISTVLNRWCKHNGRSAPLPIKSRCRSKSTHNKRSASGQSTSPFSTV